jgi:hypothetical protein
MIVKNRITRVPPILFLTAVLVFPLTTMAFAQIIDFDDNNEGLSPKGFSMTLTGNGKPGRWVVLKDETAPSIPNVLAQSERDSTDSRFPICIFDSISTRDVDVSVRFKPVNGNVDRAGGIIWRYRDKENYYLLRANALENNFRIYRVINGRRQEFGGARVKVTSNEWHILRIRNIGNLFKAYFDGKFLIEVTDDTFGGAGSVGLWTKADSYTLFDDLTIQKIKESTR